MRPRAVEQRRVTARWSLAVLFMALLELLRPAATCAMPPGAESEPGQPKNEESDRQKKEPSAPTVRLPRYGVYPAREIFRLVAELTGRLVLPATVDLAELPVTVSPEASRRESTFGELKLILRAHGVFLHSQSVFYGQRRDDDARGEPIWVASRSSLRRPREVAFHTRIFKVSPRSFSAAVKRVETYLNEKEGHLPPESPKTSFIQSARAGKIIVQSPWKASLDAVSELLSKENHEKATSTDGTASGTHLYSYAARNFRAEDLKQRMFRFLSEEEIQRVRVIIPRSRNVLWIRTDAKLWDKLRKVLKAADSPKMDP